MALPSWKVGLMVFVIALVAIWASRRIPFLANVTGA